MQELSNMVHAAPLSPNIQHSVLKYYIYKCTFLRKGIAINITVVLDYIVYLVVVFCAGCWVHGLSHFLFPPKSPGGNGLSQVYSSPCPVLSCIPLIVAPFLCPPSPQLKTPLGGDPHFFHLGSYWDHLVSSV